MKTKNIKPLFHTYILFALVFGGYKSSMSQVPGLPDPPYTREDSTIYFDPARVLIDYTTDQSLFPEHAGLYFHFSGNGFGLGGFYNYSFSELFSFTTRLSIANGRNSEEFETFNGLRGAPEVDGKINRLYFMPIDFNVKYFFLGNSVESSLRPYVSSGISPFAVIATPYREGRVPEGEVIGFFQAFGDPLGYFRVGGNIGFGANWGTNPKRDNRVELIYYYLPFTEGIESRFEDPITNFGGIFISLTLGWSID
jgi:hypothetical protein